MSVRQYGPPVATVTAVPIVDAGVWCITIWARSYHLLAARSNELEQSSEAHFAFVHLEVSIDLQVDTIIGEFHKVG